MSASVAKEGGGKNSGDALDDAFEDLEARFLLNLPREELETIHRLFFQIEQAYWFYEDFLADASKDGSLPHFGTLDAFAEEMFKRCKMLKKHKKRAKSLAQDFRKYISRIPVYGVILLNKKLTKCLMVTPYGGTSWTFPKGKVNEGESPLDCAVREVYEEVGFSCSDMMREDLYIEWTDKKTGKRTRLYVAAGAPETFAFKPRVRKEIGDIKWHPLEMLPATNDGQRSEYRYHGVRPAARKLLEIVQRLLDEGWTPRSEGVSARDDVANEVAADRGDPAAAAAHYTSGAWFPVPFRVDVGKLQ